MQTSEIKTNRVAALKSLEVGDTIVYPIEEFNSVKATCSMYGLAWKRKFKTQTDRATRTITVMRID